MSFKLVIKHCTKLDFDLIQNATGPCSLTCHPPFCPLVPMSSHLRLAGTLSLAAASLAAFHLASSESLGNQTASPFQPFLLPLSLEQDKSDLDEASSPAGPACRAWEEVSTAPTNPAFTVLVARAIPRQRLEWPVWACMPATTMESAYTRHLFPPAPPLPSDTSAPCKIPSFCSFLLPGRSSIPIYMSQFCPSLQGLGIHSSPRSAYHASSLHSSSVHTACHQRQ